MREVGNLIEGVRSWLEFLLVLIVRGGVMTAAGWFVVLMVAEAWNFSVALSLLLGTLLIIGVGLLYTMLEIWP